MDKIIKYGLLVIRDGKFLINRKKGTKFFLMPGGRPEFGESIESCLIREIKEEHKCDLIRESIEFFGEFEDIAANEPDTIIQMKVYFGKISGEPEADSEIEEQRWFGHGDNKDILSPIIKNKILHEVIKKRLLE